MKLSVHATASQEVEEKAHEDSGGKNHTDHKNKKTYHIKTARATE